MNAITINTDYNPEALPLTIEQREEEEAKRLDDLFATFRDNALSTPKTPATEWVLDQFLPEGDAILAGESFVGKTYVLTNLVGTVAGVVAHEGISAQRKRKVIWITEDKGQILQALEVLPYLPGKGREDFLECCALVDATRMPAEDLGYIVKRYLEEEVGTQHNPAWIIVDTMAASLECKDLNNSSEVSKMIASLRQSWREFSTLTTMHVGKNGNGKDPLGSVSFRADVQTCMMLTHYDGNPDYRALKFTKRRASGQVESIITRQVATETLELPNREGDLVTEYIPVISLVGHTRESREEFDSQVSTKGKPTGKEASMEKAKDALKELVDAMANFDGDWKVDTKTQLAALAKERFPDLAGSKTTSETRIGKAVDQGLVEWASSGWTFNQPKEAEL